MLATAAFCVINGKWFVAPGVIFRGALETFLKGSPMKHLVFVEPFMWTGELTSLTLGDTRVDFLQAVFISDKEMAYVDQHKFEKLSQLFEEHDVDVTDPYRKSVL